jgi:hypothetical protein
LSSSSLTAGAVPDIFRCIEPSQFESKVLGVLVCFGTILASSY